MRGRKTKLTPELQKNLLDAISVGATHRLACQYAGINQDTLYTWLNKGLEGKPPYADFSEQFMRAQGRSAVGWLAKIEAAGNEDWRALAWKLERRFPHDYGKTVNENLNIPWEALTVEQLERLGNGESYDRVMQCRDVPKDT